MEKPVDTIHWAVEAAIIIVIIAFVTWGAFQLIALFVIDSP